METVASFVSKLKANAIEFDCSEGQLRVKGPSRHLPSDSLSFIKENKNHIIKYLQEIGKTKSLSYGQLSLWTLYQLLPLSSAYNVACIVETAIEFNVEIFQQAVKTIIDRHSILRTVYSVDNNQPCQKTLDQLDIEIYHEKIHNFDEPRLQKWVNERVSIPFDLSQGPLGRIYILRNFKANNEKIEGVQLANYFILFVFHHITLDMISLNILLSELATVYNAINKKLPLHLPVLRLEYYQFAERQKRDLQTEKSMNSLKFWLEELKGELAFTKFPTDRSRPVIQGYSGDACSFVLDDCLKIELLKSCKSFGVTLYVLMLTAYYILLYRYTGQSDLIIGTPTAGRDIKDTETMIGYFANVVCLRNFIEGDVSFIELLKRTRQKVALALEHNNIPFPFLVEKLQLIRDPSFQPVFNIMFNWNQSSKLLENVSSKNNNFISKLTLIGNGGASHDFILNIVDGVENMALAWAFNSQLFDRTTFCRVNVHYLNILQNIIKNPHITIDSIELLPLEEMQRLRTHWNQPSIVYNERNLCIHNLFESKVLEQPNNIALVIEDRKISYGELNTKANQLAHYLIEHHIQRENLVFVTLKRSIEQIIVILAIMKVQAAYVPIDSQLPKLRIEEIEENAKPALVISSSEYQFLYKGSKTSFFDYNDLKQQQMLEKYSQSNVQLNYQPNDLAYVIFTSGSTGKPKGVSIEHQGACNTIIAINKLFQISKQDCCLALSALNFDLSVYDIFGCLARGAKIILLPEKYTRDPAYWVNMIEKHQVTIWNSVPALMQMLTSYLSKLNLGRNKADNNLSIDKVLLSGDWVPLSLPNEVHTLVNPCAKIFSLGGATEASIWSIAHEVKETNPAWNSIPYGKALPNQSFYVFNDALEHCPIGVVGELYIGGLGVARNYLNDPDRTRESFILHPKSGERLYKTGDLGRYFENGDIEFIGRKDNQVKLHGFRIELGEVESVLNKHPQVMRAIAMICDDNNNQKCLVAYIEPNFSATEKANTATLVSQDKQVGLAQFNQNSLNKFKQEIKEHSYSTLPKYMIPSHFIVMSFFPLTETGKIDFKSLPKPDYYEKKIIDFEKVTVVERKLLDIWGVILKHHDFDVEDNFFLKGGNSLLAIALHNEIVNSFKKEISIAEIFAHPYIKSIARYLEEKNQEEPLLEKSRERFNRRREKVKQ